MKAGRLLLLGPFIALFLLSPTDVVVLHEAEGGQRLLAHRAAPGDRFTLQYIHSMYRVPQAETFRVDYQHRMVLEELFFGSFAAVQYYGENLGHGRLVRYGDTYRLEDIGLPLARVRFRVGYTADHQLIVNGRSFPLLRLAAAGDALELKVAREPWLIYLARGGWGH